MTVESRLELAVERLLESIGAQFDTRLHPHDRVGRFARKPKLPQVPRAPRARADVGITPFRPEDEVAGFYDSAKFKRFCGDMRRIAREHGVKIDHVDRAAGVWEGETEPSLAVAAHDHETGVAAWAASLGKQYDQDGVLLFAPAPDGDSASYSFAVEAGHDAEALAAMSRHGIPGGRLRAGRLEVIGQGLDFHAKVDALAGDLGPYDATVGKMTLLERGRYNEAIAADPR